MQKIQSAKWLLPLGLAAAPFVLRRDLVDPGLTPGFLYLLSFLAGITCALWLNDKQKFICAFSDISNRKNVVFIVAMVWLVAALCSVPVALQKSESAAEVARILFFILSYLLVSAWLRFNENCTTGLAIGFCIVAAILTFIGFFDFQASWKNIIAGDSYYALSGNMGNRNLLAIMLSLCLPLHFIVFENFTSRVIRGIVAVNFSLAVTLIFLSGSRAGWLGLFIFFAISLLALGVAARKEFVSRKFILFITGVCLTACAIPVLIVLSNAAFSNIAQQRVQSFYNFKSESNPASESIRERLMIWENSVALIKDNPLTGVGAGNWKVRNPEKGLAGRAAQGNVVFQQPHNDYLWVASETGIPGGMAFLGIVILPFFLAVKRKKATRLKYYVIRVAQITGIAMYAIHSFFDFPKERPLVLFTLAVLIALTYSAEEQIPNKQISTQKKSYLFGVVVLLLLFSAIFWAIRMQSEFYIKKALDDRAAGRTNSEIANLNKVYSCIMEADLSGVPLDWYIAEAKLLQGDSIEGKKFIEKALCLNPNHLFSLYTLGAIESRQGNSSAAIRWWEKANAIAPEFTQAGINLSAAYYNQQNFVRAAEVVCATKIDYSDNVQTSILHAVLGKYVYTLSDTVSYVALRNALIKTALAHDELRLIQQEAQKGNSSLNQIVFYHAILKGAKEKSISDGETERLTVSYK